MPLGITAEEAAYFLFLLKQDIEMFGGLEEIKTKRFAKNIDFEGLMTQLKIIAEIGDKAEDCKICFQHMQDTNK